MLCIWRVHWKVVFQGHLFFFPRQDRRSRKTTAPLYSSREYVLKLGHIFVFFKLFYAFISVLSLLFINPFTITFLIYTNVYFFFSAATCTYEINTFYTKIKELGPSKTEYILRKALKNSSVVFAKIS
ncbi:hypothetical protein AB4K20DRAFT_1524502 [Rhizopus microsporus]